MDIEQLKAAAKQGIINDKQVEQLLAFSNDDKDSSGEQLSFIRGFGDIFITLGIIFVVVAGAQIDLGLYFNLIPILILAFASEWLIKLKRLILPGMAIFLSILYFSNEVLHDFGIEWFFGMSILSTISLLFYLRYKMPFSLVAIAIGVLLLLNDLIGIDWEKHQYVLSLYGLGVFIVAMWFDSHDTKRLGRFSDSAFWLHLLSAPLIVHGVMITLLLTDQGMVFKEIFMVVFFIIFFLLALFVDRRSFLVSSLFYAIYSIIMLSHKVGGVKFEDLTLSIFIIFGIFIVFFGTYWYKVRTILFSKLRDTRLAKLVPKL